MKTILILPIILLLTASLFSTTWIINQDGTGDFTTISAGITVAVDGDTLLVYPGVYYENISYQGKNITISSLYDGDLYDETYIANTIIDGSHEGTVVVFNSNETRNAVLNGFTIRHGLGELHVGTLTTQGGGIFISYSSPTISNCRIRDNRAYDGAGLNLLINGSPLLKGNVISHNHSVRYGGLSAGVGANIEFCSEELNSIYYNHGGRMTDLFLGGTQQTSVTLDTMTVINPDRYFVVYSRFIPADFELIVNHGKIETAPADLYVSPFGSDDNSGLTPDEPLQTIAMAMIKVQPDSLHQRTVYLAEGLYSRSLNNQLFPIQFRSFVDIEGANRETTIFDLEQETLAFFGVAGQTSHYPDSDPVNRVRNFTIKNLTITNGSNPLGRIGRGAVYLSYSSYPTMENISIVNCHTGNTVNVTMGQETVLLNNCYGTTLKNLSIDNCSGHHPLRAGNGYTVAHNTYIENLRIRNNSPGSLNPNHDGGEGGGLLLIVNDSSGGEPPLNVTMVNLEITDNVLDNIAPYWGNPPYSFIYMYGPSGNVRIINATIGNNYSSSSNISGIKFGESVTYELINSIVYGNIPHEISIQNDRPVPANITISHSLINGGNDGILFFGSPNYNLYWGEGNLDNDPLWMGDAYPEYPYMLSENSPARNAGTLDILNFEFPEFDLAGNPRIYGDSIDMGAYEYQGFGTGIEDDALPELADFDYNLFNYPNPVVSLQSDGNRGGSTGTRISFQLPKDGHVVVDIYNLKGQFVRRVTNAFMTKGEHTSFWNGKDDLERYVATGFYMYKLEIDGRMVATGRCTFIK